jgi:hypothetical protein
MTAKLALLAALAAGLAVPAQGLAAPTRAALPLQGVLVPGRTLGGVALGDSVRRVTELWGANRRRCQGCTLPTWFYTYDDRDETRAGLGAGVAFRGGRVVAVFTLGAPFGWRTSDGLKLGEIMPKAAEVYGPGFRWRSCVGYMAMSMPTGAGTVTSIYTDGNVVYGFALTHPSLSVCQ